MPTDTDTDIRSVAITARMEQIIKHMLSDTRRKWSAPEICTELGIPGPTVSEALRTMRDAGWISREVQKDAPTRPRHLYRFTRGTVMMLRKAVR